MTGFGAAAGNAGGVTVTVEIRSVNHRFFTPTFKLPASLGRHEIELRDVLRSRVRRGHVTVFMRIERSGGESASLDRPLIAAWLKELRELASENDLAPPDLNLIAKLPGAFALTQEEAPVDFPALLGLFGEAVRAFDDMRIAEGARLGELLATSLMAVGEALGRVEERAPVRVLEQRDRLRDAVRQLTEGVAVDEQRIAQEIAILAERLDVAEETGRLRSHLSAFRETLESDVPDGAGKRLGFLLQEMLREVNTIGSKAADSAILRDVVLMKEELERLREQVENIE